MDPGLYVPIETANDLKAHIKRLEAALRRIIEAWDGDSDSMCDDPAEIAKEALSPTQEPDVQ